MPNDPPLSLQGAYLRERLRNLAHELAGRPCALFGAGHHTRDLLKLMPTTGLHIQCILDDAAQPGSFINAIPVENPASVDPDRFHRVIVSSAVHERKLRDRAIAWTGSPDKVVTLYQGVTIDEPPPASASPVLKIGNFDQTYTSAIETTGGVYTDSAKDRFYNLVQLLRATCGLPGHTIEAGCYRGLTSSLMCHTLRSLDPSFDGTGHHIVDSFEGLGEPTPLDGEDAHACWSRGQFTDTSLDHLRRVLADFPGVHYTKGWIPQVLPQLPTGPFRFVHIDVDLHDPTLQCLEHFYPALVPGGMIVIDDYGPWTGDKWKGCQAACQTFERTIPEPIVPLSTGNAVLIRRP